MMKSILAAALLMAPVFGLSAQNDKSSNNASEDLPMMQLLAGKIVLYPDRMGMTGSESLMTCLQSLPALVQKGTVDLLSNFTLKEDGSTYLQDATIYLEQTQVSEVAYIEIITDGSVSDGMSGVMGIINIVTKDVAPGTHGHVDMMMNTHGEVYPAIYASYKKGYFSVTGNVLGLYDHDKTDITMTTTDGDASNEFIREKYRTIAGKTKLKWVLPHDYFHVKISELYGYDRTRDTLNQTVGGVRGLQKTYSKTNSNKINLNLEYDHTFKSGGVFQVSGGVEYINDMKNSESLIGQDSSFASLMSDTQPSTLDDTYSNSTSWSATLEYFTNISNWMYVCVSLPMSWTWVDEDIYRVQSADSESSAIRKIAQNTRTDNYDPYFISTFKLGKKWDINIGVRCSIAKYWLSYNNNDNWDETRTAFFSNFGVRYVPADGHTLQFNWRHTASKPTALQLYPYRWFAQSPNIYFVGDENLKSSKFQVYDLSYVFHRHRLQLSASGQYYVNRDPIETTTIASSDSETSTSWVGWTDYNAARIRAFDSNVSAVYSFGMFQAMAGVNVYHQINSSDEHLTWCCVRVSPIVKFPRQWTLSAQVSYVSPQHSEVQHISESYYGLVRLAKTWSFGLSAFAYWENFLNHAQTVRTATSVTRTQTHENKISIGLSYTFL